MNSVTKVSHWLSGYFLVISAFFGCSETAISGGVSFVAVDQSEAAFTVFTGIPDDLDESRFADIKKKVERSESLTLLPWSEFIDQVPAYIQSTVRRNDYPGYSIKKGLVCLIYRAAGAPWGLTWNGGIALTYNDYQHARQSFSSFNADPTAYTPIRDPGKDPVNPWGHLPAFGCQ